MKFHPHDLSQVDIDPPSDPQVAAARELLGNSIRKDYLYSVEGVLKAGFAPDGLQFAAWFYKIKASMY